MIPPSFGAHAFHASSTTSSTDGNQVVSVVPPPMRKPTSSEQGFGATSTSNHNFGSPIAVPVSLGVNAIASPPTRVVASPMALSASDALFSSQEDSTLDFPNSEPAPSPFGIAPPPSGTKRESAAHGSNRTRRLPAPTASFAATTVAPKETKDMSFVPPSPFNAPLSSSDPFQTSELDLSQQFFTEFKPLAPAGAQNLGLNGASTFSPVLGSSMFSPAGKGSHLFDSEPHTSQNHGNGAPHAIPTSTADLFDDDPSIDANELSFGVVAPIPSRSLEKSPFAPQTTAQVVSKLFDSTPSPDLPISSFPPAVAQKLSISESSVGLFDEDEDDGSSELFGAPATNISTKQAPIREISFPVPSPSHISGNQPPIQNQTPFLAFEAPKKPDSDLFEDTKGDFLDMPVSAPLSASLPASDTKPVPVAIDAPKSLASDLFEDDGDEPFGEPSKSVPASDPFPAAAPKPSESPFPPTSTSDFSSSLFGEAEIDEPIFMTLVSSLPTSQPLESPKSPEPSLLETEKAKPSLPEAPAVVSVSPVRSAGFIGASDSLFGEPDDGELDFGQMPAVVPPLVAKSVVEDLPPKMESIAVPSPSLVPAPVPSAPNVPLEHEKELVEPVAQEVAEMPQFSNPGVDVAMSAPPMASLSGRKAGVPPRAAPKRPRHFQFQAGQPIAVPSGTASALFDSAAPPKSGASLPFLDPAVPSVETKRAAAVEAPFQRAQFPSPIVAFNGVNLDSQAASSMAEAEESEKRSIFDPLEQVKSKGLSWIKTALSHVVTSPSPSAPESSAQSQGDSYDNHMGAENSEVGAIQGQALSFEKTVAAPLPMTALPAVSVATHKKRKPVVRPGAFKSTVEPSLGLGGNETKNTETASVALSAPVASTIKPSNTIFAENSGFAMPLETHTLEDSPFAVANGLVSIDYSTPPHSNKSSAVISSDADPFGSDATVSATDLFLKLRSFASTDPQATSTAPSPPTTTLSLVPHPSAVEIVTPTHTARGGSGEFSEPSTPHTSMFSPSAKQEIEALQLQIEQLNDDLRSKTEENKKLKSEAYVAAQNAASVRETEQQLRAQLTQLVSGTESTARKALEVEMSETQKTRDILAQTQRLNAELEQRITRLDEKVIGLEKANATLVREHNAKLSEVSSIAASTQASTQAVLETRISGLEKSLTEARQQLAAVQALADEAPIWKSKYESECANTRRLVAEFETKMNDLEEEYSEKLLAQARMTQQGKDNETTLAQLKASLAQESVDVRLELERKHAEEISRIQAENERYIVLMQQQAASQTSVIDRLIHQNADLIKAVEFAKRVYQESKNPDSLSSFVAENDRLREDLETCETELTTLRHRNKELELKANHFESECEELLKRLSSIDYRLLVSGPPPVSSSSSSLPTSSPAPAPPASQVALAGPNAVSQQSPSTGSSSASTALSPSASASMVPNTPGIGDWQPKSPVLSLETIVSDSPGKSPSRFIPPATSSSDSSLTLGALTTAQQPPKATISPFVVTGPIVSHLQSPVPGIQHSNLSPQINLDDLDQDDTVQAELGDSSSAIRPFASSDPIASPNRALKVPPSRGIMGRIWQAVTLQ